MCLHKVTAPTYLKAPDFSKLRPTFKATIVILVGAGVVAGCERRFF